MTEPDTGSHDGERHMFQVRETARREAFRLARNTGAPIVTRPMYRGDRQPAVRDVEPLAGARAARDLEAAARGTARDYIRQAREAGHGWERIGQALGLAPDGGSRGGATPADAAFTHATGAGRADPPWEPRYFGWTCRSCDKTISDQGVIGGPADDELGHAEDCARHAAEIAQWNAEAAKWAADWEAGQ